jgi:hypothetical protein
MDPVTHTPTEPRDYALLSTVYGTLLTGVAVSARDKEPIPKAEMLPLAAATFALSKLLVKEKVETWVRSPFVEESPDGRRPKGRGLRFAMGELLSCTRCTGGWAALALVGLRLHAPATGRTVTTVLATSAGSDFLHSAFTWLCARADTQAHDKSLTGAAVERLSAAPRAS